MTSASHSYEDACAIAQRWLDTLQGPHISIPAPEIKRADLLLVAGALLARSDGPNGELLERLEQAETIIAWLTMDHNSGPNYVKGFDMAHEHFAKYPNAPASATGTR